ncbi:hypothetical protein Klosneuvirus_3_146 [Klosneuvirus KNV1]|uniref:Uncharacterized protein n=1 Tax=Klosneuvirus KNV1 TaxID=1977640 RepID=A0A1V0SK17_9VIRU|nr:hypothetical protein Klosneuvirus_3_146 [Klosneuvirus KNV1]
MGNRPVKYKYEKLFDPRKFDIESSIKYYQFIEKNFPLGDIDMQIEKCSKYFFNLNRVDNLERYMHEGAYLLALIREIKKENKIKNNDETSQYYDKLYKEIYDTLVSIG